MKYAVAVLAAWLTALVLVSSVLAHAVLVRSVPGENAVLAQAPQEVRLWFNETISPQFSTARVLDIDGREVSPVSVQTDPGDPFLLVIKLPPLGNGLYSVNWRVLSEADGHFTAGLLVFAVGEGTAIEMAGDSETAEPLPWLEIALRWLNFILLALLIGGIGTAWLVLVTHDETGALASEVEAARGRILALSSWCAGISLLVGMGALAYQLSELQAGLVESTSVLRSGWQFLAGSRWGILWWARQGLLLALLVLLLFAHRGRRTSWDREMAAEASLDRPAGRPRGWPAWMAGSMTFGLALIQAMNGHAAALTPDSGLAIAADTLHLAGAGMWVGGLLALVIGFAPALWQEKRDPGALLQAGWGHFGRWAVLSLGLLAATGIYSAGRQVASIDALLTSRYGQALIVKMILFAGACSLGLLNGLTLHPRLVVLLARLLGKPNGWQPLPMYKIPAFILVEAGLGLLMFGLAGVLTATPPAHGPRFAPAAQELPKSLSQTVDDLLVTLAVRPNLPGQNVFTVQAISTRRPAPAEVLRVILRFRYLDQDLGSISADAQPEGGNLYRLGGNYLNLAGPWQVEVVVRRKGIEDGIALFNWTVASRLQSQPGIISRQAWGPPLIKLAGVLLGLTLAYGAGLAILTRSQRSPGSASSRASTPGAGEINLTIHDN